jgi:tetratricopeptide (TPR) repeat protein
VDQGLSALESARQIAIELDDMELGAKSLTQAARLLFEAGDLDDAEQHLNLVDEIVPPGGLQSGECKAVLGRIRMRQARHAEAAVLFREAAAASRNEASSLHLALILNNLGDTYAAMDDPERTMAAYAEALDAFEQHRLGLFEASRLEAVNEKIFSKLIALRANPASKAYDATEALHLLERGKSRTFTEILGLSHIPIRNATEEVRSRLEEEKQLLADVTKIRETLFLKPDGSADRLRVQQKLSILVERLRIVWTKIGSSFPEYNEIRNGSVIRWNEYQGLLTS